MQTGNFLRAYINKISLKRGHEILCGTLAYLYPFSVLFACNANDWNYMILQLYIERTEPPLNITEVHPIYRSVMLDLNFWRGSVELVSCLPIFCIILCIYQVSFIR